MKSPTASVAAGLGYLLAVALYAVLAGIAATPVSEPTPRIPALLFAVVVPGVAAFSLAAGSVLLWRRLGIRAPTVGLVGGSIVAGFAGPDAGLAYVLLLGGFGWLALLAVAELLGRTVGRRLAGESLPADERAGVLGSLVGLAYAVLFGLVAVGPAWASATGPSVPDPLEATLTIAYLAGAFCLLFGLPVALVVRHGLVSPLIVPVLWLAFEVGTGWHAYTVDPEIATIVYFLVWPAAMLAFVAFAVGESLGRRGWRRFRQSAPPLARSDDRTA